MNEKRLVLNDLVCLRFAPLFPGKRANSSRTGGDNRLFLEEVFWRVRAKPGPSSSNWPKSRSAVT